MNWFDRFRPYISRFLLAPAAILVANKIAKDTGHQIDSESLRVAADLALYGVIHKVSDKVLNPADSASAHLAASGVEEHKAMKVGN